MADEKTEKTGKGWSESLQDSLGVVAFIAAAILAGSRYRDRIATMWRWVTARTSDGYQWIRASYRTTAVDFTRRILFRALVILAVFQIAEVVLLFVLSPGISLGYAFWLWWALKFVVVLGGPISVIALYWRARALDPWERDRNLNQDQFLAKYGPERSPVTGWVTMLGAFLLEGIWLMGATIALYSHDVGWVRTIPISALSFIALVLALGVYAAATELFGAVVKAIEAVCGVAGVAFRAAFAAALPGVTQENVDEKIKNLDPGLARLRGFLATGHIGTAAGIGLLWALSATLPFATVVLVGLLFLLIGKVMDSIFVNHGMPTLASKQRSFRLAGAFLTATVAVWVARLLWEAFSKETIQFIEAQGLLDWKLALVGLAVSLAVLLALRHSLEETDAAAAPEPGKVSLKPLKVAAMVLVGAISLYMAVSAVAPLAMKAHGWATTKSTPTPSRFVPSPRSGSSARSVPPASSPPVVSASTKHPCPAEPWFDKEPWNCQAWMNR